MVHAIQWLVTSWALAMIISDISARRIPNLFSLGGAVLAIVYLAATGDAVLGGGWLDVGIGVLLSLLLTLPAYMLRWLGGGDVKLLFAIAVLGGWQAVLVSFAIGGLLAGAIAVVWPMIVPYFGYSLTSKRWLPFGAALSAGLLVVIGARS